MTRYNELWEIYFNRKLAKHKNNKDNKPFTKREIRLMRVAFQAGYNWYRFRLKGDEKNV